MPNKILSLSKRIVDFLMEYNPYDAPYEDEVTEMEQALWDVKRRRGIAADLKGMAEYHEDDVLAYKASMLWREVIAL